MFFRTIRLVALPFAALMLAGFRMPATENVEARLLYDVRGAFVTAAPDIPRELIAWTDSLVDASIQATTRSFMLPRTILTVKIGETGHAPALFGSRYSASVTVKAISVGSGEPVAEGSFETSVFRFGTEGTDILLAEKIAERIASEFGLEAARRKAVLTALSEEIRH